MLYPKLDYNPDYPLPDLDPRKNGVDQYLSVEALSAPGPGYLELQFAEAWRERAVAIIFNVARRENLEPVIPYLAMNYYDRYVSGGNPVPVFMKSRQNDREFLCLCCLILAWKMREKHFSAVDFLGRHAELAVITPEKLLAMELHILKGLDWRLRSVTALCFVQFLTPELNSTYGFRRRTITQIIMNAQNDFKNTRFRPSVMAAAAILSASWFLYPGQYEKFVEKMASKIIFEEGNLSECVGILIQQCKELNTLIESAVAKNEYLPKMMVRAGEIHGEEEEQISGMAKGAGMTDEQASPEPSGRSEQASGGELKQPSKGILIQNPETINIVDKSRGKQAVPEQASGGRELKKPSDERLTQNPEEAKMEDLTREEAERQRKGKAEVGKAETGGIPAASEDYPAEFTPSLTQNPEEAKTEELAREEAERQRKGKTKMAEAGMAAASEDYPAEFTLRWRLGEKNTGEFLIFTRVSDRPNSQLRRRFRQFCCGLTEPELGL